MNVRIVCVGKLKERFYEDAQKEFVKRLGRFGGVEITELPDEKAPETLSPAQQQQVMEREGERILHALKPEDRVIALAIGGKRYTSEAFSEHLAALRDGGTRSVAFVIGGSLGLSKAVLDRADEKLSLSDMTFPHRIARIVLLEQIYRAFKIDANEPYHK